MTLKVHVSQPVIYTSLKGSSVHSYRILGWGWGWGVGVGVGGWVGGGGGGGGWGVGGGGWGVAWGVGGGWGGGGVGGRGGGGGGGWGVGGGGGWGGGGGAPPFTPYIQILIAIFIYIHIKWTVFVNVTTKSAQHTCADDCYNCWKKSKLKSYVRPWFHG